MLRTPGRRLLLGVGIIRHHESATRTLTGAKRDDDGARAYPDYDTAVTGQCAICRVENPQDERVVALEFVKHATLWTLEVAPCAPKLALLCADPVKETRLVGY
jgi:hypothetical protein